MIQFWTALASVFGFWGVYRTLIQSVIPPEAYQVVIRMLQPFLRLLDPYCHYDIVENDGVNTNQLYNSVNIYLINSAAAAASDHLILNRSPNSPSITISLTNNHRISDVFNGIKVVWDHHVTTTESQTPWRRTREERRGFTLRMNKRDKRMYQAYLDFVTARANEITRNSRELLLYTNSRGETRWESVPFKHPSTFETLAMDPVKKSDIMSDLKEFTDGEDFYKRTGRAWKRGYLLYGPPGTGKSSMIAAMANHLQYNIFDLQLSQVANDSDLRRLVMRTSAKSIVVMEDIDCSIKLTNRLTGGGRINSDDAESKSNGNSLTLSGLLNFTDGLWSCCGSERIFVFTTNHIENLDPALLRSGRMDMHILMSYCTFPALNILLRNYLGYDDVEIGEGVLADVIDEAEMTPADIGEVLIKYRRDKDRAVTELLEAMKKRVLSRNR